LATHRHAGVEAIRQRKPVKNRPALAGLFLAVLVVVAHDLAATVYTVGAINSAGAVAALLGMCALTLLPFLTGYMSHAIAAGIQEEDAQRASRKIAHWKQKAELRYWKGYYKQWQPPTLPAPQELTLTPVIITQEPGKNQHQEVEAASSGQPF
jgi:hypothetical protein